MKLLHGISRNFHRPLVARIEDVNCDAKGVSHLLRSYDETVPYALLRSGWPNKGVFVHPSLLLEQPICFSPGDIVRVTPEGECLRLYEASSTDNALFLTGACNSACLMCPQPPVRHCSGYREEISDMLGLMDPSPVALGITGGEPTLVLDDLVFILRKIFTLHQGCYINILTNGRVLSDFVKAAMIYSACNNITFCVPLYSDVSDVHDMLTGISGSFGETIEGIGNLLRLGASIEIRMVVTALNYKRLPQWSEFLYRNMPAINHVAIMGMEPIGFARTNLEMLWIEPDTYASQLSLALRNFQRQGMPVSLYNYQLCLLPESLRSMAVKSISGWKVRFAPECKECSIIDSCGGFFFSALAMGNIKVHPVLKRHGE